MRNGFSRLFEFKILLLILDIIGSGFLFLTIFLGFSIEDNLTDFQRGLITGAISLYTFFVTLNLLNKKMNRRRGEI
ncbi:MAG: hypothetical protein COY38_00670 [Candidatus Aenigmarchaeota archaeon CG_4_10_14_0_8_um_filter_37_24]|nr:hypothetical protein [Candidatus Aenigmarchaeota archaeon]OIN86229.1 MAG: hypothetical protein AUJ50_04105 [Candidatus Aenigmarchaeota archaeon CG1_02_38_14]PIV69299.1 MAG: hypothetical protein COS07_01270 [Candidatus Aenigmarchaeota archaeon CG01_land_8_20_14_3_00_37_9]PIW41353.1 MAG: hypothetical protein COW21_02485 [Candidatus Aenigmarchaeota archaeon CG15_BIG_FIL_POST_REV_8_21_14_020_37_27]PIX50676.1 MAG: hypothetical protein COZ52_02710 [Candidatus Aenigmarchaeota archaeon CG_4_8_14_3_u